MWNFLTTALISWQLAAFAASDAPVAATKVPLALSAAAHGDDDSPPIAISLDALVATAFAMGAVSALALLAAWRLLRRRRSAPPSPRPDTAVIHALLADAISRHTRVAPDDEVLASLRFSGALTDDDMDVLRALTSTARVETSTDALADAAAAIAAAVERGLAFPEAQALIDRTRAAF